MGEKNETETNKQIETKYMPKIKQKGRPCIIDWAKVAHAWRSNTDGMIARMVGCSTVNVHLRRKRLIAKSIAEGKDGSFYTCSLPRWTRIKTVDKQRELQKT